MIGIQNAIEIDGNRHLISHLPIINDMAIAINSICFLCCVCVCVCVCVCQTTPNKTKTNNKPKTNKQMYILNIHKNLNLKDSRIPANTNGILPTIPK